MEPTVVDGNRMTYYDLGKTGWKYSLVGEHAYQVPIYPKKKIQYPAKNPWVSLSPDGTLWFRDGYQWDGCSGPTIDDKSNMRAGLKHDGLYQLGRAGLLSEEWREKCDYVLYDTFMADGGKGWRGLFGIRPRLFLAAVRKMAGFAYAKGHDAVEDIEVAP